MPRHRLYKKTVITSLKTATAPLPPTAFGQVLDQLREHHTLLALQLTSQTGLCPLGSCLHPFPRCASPGNLGQQRAVEEQYVGFGLRIVRHWRPCCSSTAGAVLRSTLASEIGRPRPSQRLPVVRPRTGSSIGFLEGEHRLFAQLLYEQTCGSVRVCAAGQDLVSILARHRAGGGLKDRALMLPELGTSLRAAVACTNAGG